MSVSFGDYSTANLVEGNHSYCKIEMDDFWGRSGPYNTLYRNRIVPRKVCFDSSGENWGRSGLHLNLMQPPHFCSTLGDCPAGATLCADMHWSGITTEKVMEDPESHVVLEGGWNIIGNIAPSLHGRPGCEAAVDCGEFDQPSNVNPPAMARNVWLEGNVFGSQIVLDSSYGDPDLDCGTGTGKMGCPGDNVVAPQAPASWYTSRFSSVPASLFKSRAPDWWCQEACAFDDPHRSIGAFGDKAEAGQVASLCKLPAQIRYEGGSCTPLP